MSCRNVASRLNAYLDGELSPAQAQRVEEALAKDAEAAKPAAARA
jgi:anti-sigma factor RsiW